MDSSILQMIMRFGDKMKLSLDRPNLILNSFDMMVHRQMEKYLKEDHDAYVNQLLAEDAKVKEYELFSLADNILGGADA